MQRNERGQFLKGCESIRKGCGWSEVIGNRVVCRTCGKARNLRPLPTCPTQHMSHFQLYGKDVYDNLRKSVLVAYGGKCSCCEYSDLTTKVRGRSFLEIDHIDGVDELHPRIRGGTFYRWLKHENYPPGFRVLCASCNSGMEYGASRCKLHASGI